MHQFVFCVYEAYHQNMTSLWGMGLRYPGMGNPRGGMGPMSPEKYQHVQVLLVLK